MLCICAGHPATKYAVTDSNESAKVYCGAKLADTLQSLCKGNYQTLRPVYRGRHWRSADDSTPSRSRRRNRGVFNECCEKPCSQQELSMYCGAPYSRSRSR
ncbi:hypothetical protein ABEB36_004441 [Hypothenemus hampei]|uniref:Insulin-like domain-containing protein n=1 Tax=Hypothenemus hampei TaxID=57062 RepID=A0ABD1F3B2_HYPHA